MSVISDGGYFTMPTRNGFAYTHGINYTGAVWGSPMPISAGFRSITGTVIWAGDPYKVNEQTVHIPAIPGIEGSQDTGWTTWDILRTFAISLGRRLNPDAPAPQVRRVWADGKLIYANGSSIPPLVYRGSAGGYIPTGSFSDGVYLTTPGNGVPVAPVQSNLTFRFCDGNENQLPDQAIVADLGPLAPAYRNQMTMVIEGFYVGSGRLGLLAGIEPGTGTTLVGSTPGALVPSFPKIEVELVDGVTVTVSGHDFTMLDDATPITFGDAVIAANFDTRELCVVAPTVSGGFINYYDMDSATQTACTAITGNGGEAIGPTNGFTVWDTLNDVVYTERAGDHCICSVGRDGAVISTALTIGVNLAPFNIDNTTITDAKPAIGFPRPSYGDLAYVIQAGALLPVLLAGRSFIAAFSPSLEGVVPGQLYPRQYIQTAQECKSIKAFPLAQRSATKTHLSYQDAAFVVAYSDAVELVCATIGSDGVSKILGRQVIYTPAHSGSTVTATLDNLNNVVVQEFKVGETTLFSKISIDLNGPADLSTFPGFRGSFPAVGDILVDKALTPDVTLPWEGNSIVKSDLSANTYGQIGGQLISLADGSTLASITGFNGLDSTTSIWDSPIRVRYFHGNVAAGQTFTGHGMRFGQVFSGVSGELDNVGAYIRDIAHYIGFQNAVLDIDPALTDQVPGVLILKPYDVTVLFDSMGELYEFNHFNSGGKLKFSRATNSPVKASGNWNITGTIADGATATIGASVYRFKTVPVAPFDVKIGVNTGSTPDAKQKTAANFLAAINADLTLAAPDAQTDGFFAGTVKNTEVTATSLVSSTDNNGFTGIALFASFGGVAGNSIVTTVAGTTGMAFVHVTLTSGAEPPAADVTLTAADLAMVNEQQLSDFDVLVTTIAPPGQSQNAAAVNYYALELNYKPSQQTFIPDDQNGELGVTGASTNLYDLPFIMDTSEAYARVARTAFRQADNVILQQFRLPQRYCTLEPSDVLAVTIPPYSYTLRIDEATFNGDFSTSFAATNYSFRSDVEIVNSDANGRLPQTVSLPSDAMPLVVDAPLLDPAFQTIPGNIDLFDGVRAYRAGFVQASLSAGLVVTGQTVQLAQLLTTVKDTKWGTVVGDLPAAVEPYYATVEDSILINCKTIDPSRDLATAAYIDMVEGRNCIAVGTPGNWEYIFFRDVEIVNSKVARLTGLVRAQRGTDYAVGTHTASDIVVLLNSVAAGFTPNTLVPQSIAASEADSIYRYKADGLPAFRLAPTVDVTVKGYVLYPFSPCHLSAELAVGDDIDLAWVRRDRLGTEFVTEDQTLSETAELYDLEIMDGDDVVRALTDLVTPSYTYDSADQVTDGFTTPLATLKVRVYQKGELGRGFPRMETLNVE